MQLHILTPLLIWFSFLKHPFLDARQTPNSSFKVLEFHLSITFFLDLTLPLPKKPIPWGPTPLHSYLQYKILTLHFWLVIYTLFPSKIVISCILIYLILIYLIYLIWRIYLNCIKDAIIHILFINKLSWRVLIPQRKTKQSKRKGHNELPAFRVINTQCTDSGTGFGSVVEHLRREALVPSPAPPNKNSDDDSGQLPLYLL